LHAAHALPQGTGAVTIRYPDESQGYGTVMNIGGLGLIVTRRRFMQLENNVSFPVVFCRDVPPPKASETVEQQILDFLEGRTHGEDLLHALYDHVLDEPIPERMRAQFRVGSAD
jgi:hypothetical protein